MYVSNKSVALSLSGRYRAYNWRLVLRKILV